MAEDTKIKPKKEKTFITQIKEYKPSNGKGLETYYYPNNIMTDEMVNKTVIFMAMKGKSLGDEKLANLENFKKGESKPSLDEVIGMAVLPLTSTISDDQSHKWSESSYLSAITGASSGMASSLKGKGKVGRFFKGVSSTLSFIEDSSQRLGALSDAFGIRKPMLNPGQFQNYSGSDLRSFSFDFTFIPESESERDQVINIVKFFKRCSSPSTPKWTENTEANSISSRMVMLAPMTWEVFVCNKTVNNLLSFHKCVCTKVSVKYGDSEKVAMFKDGMIKQITLSLSFSECELQTSRSYGDTEEWSDIITEVGKFMKNTAEDALKSTLEFVGLGGLVSDDSEESEETLPEKASENTVSED
jgi:hypothetical protein